MLRRRSAVVLAAICVVAATTALAARARSPQLEGHLRFQGKDRSYVLHLPPSYTGKRRVPLVIVLHGASANPEWVEKESAFGKKADREGFIVVYPRGSPMGRRRDSFVWNSGGMDRMAPSADDVGFIRAVVQQVKQRYRIDPKRIFATGMSNGGMMAHRLGSEAPDLAAAIAPVAGTLNVPCRAGPPVPVIMVHGMRDEMVAFYGRHQGWLDLASVPESVQAWVKRNGCRPKPERTERDGLVVERYAGGKAGSEVVLYAVKDGKRGSFSPSERTMI